MCVCVCLILENSASDQDEIVGTVFILPLKQLNVEQHTVNNNFQDIAYQATKDREEANSVSPLIAPEVRGGSKHSLAPPQVGMELGAGRGEGWKQEYWRPPEIFSCSPGGFSLGTIQHMHARTLAQGQGERHPKGVEGTILRAH